MELQTYTAFRGDVRLAGGRLVDLALSLRAQPGDAALVFDDRTGRVVDLDLSGSEADLRARYAAADEPSKGPGRPKLGVVAREVTLLPRHWEWLSSQPGGASVALRRLIDAARKHNEADDRRRESRERVYRFLHAVAGDFSGFEAASRALFAGDRTEFFARLDAWPEDVATYARQLSTDAFDL